jgi:sarcosine oxidase
MERMTFDAIVLGLGAMGSAAAFHLASRGKSVLGVEQFTSPHDKGSSHGGSRIIRQAYWEGADYIPLVQRAYDLWRRLEKDSATRLLHITGGLFLGSRHGDLVSSSIAACEKHSIPFEVLDSREVEQRFPVFLMEPGDAAVYEPNAGYLVPEECIRAHLELASRAGAELRFEEKVLSWSAVGDHVEVRTSRGSYHAGHLVIAAGPWANEALHSVVPLRVTRQVMAWIAPRDGVSCFLPERFPVFVAEDAGGGAPIYGFPAIDGEGSGVKAALHGSDDVCMADNVNRVVDEIDIQRIQEKLMARIPELDGELVRAKTCLYTTTPDEHFVIGPHPQVAPCTIACGFSGHGFKFSSVVGEVLADLATNGKTAHPIAQFDPRRFPG